MKKVLFIDRDGTIIIEPDDEQVDSFEKMEFLPGAITNLAKISRETDYELVMVTNQDGLGTDSFPENTFWPVHNMMLKILENEGVAFTEILIDKHFPHDNAETRKPGTGMLTQYMNEKYDLVNSYVIGDRIADVQLAKNLGSKSIFIGNDKDPGADLVARSWTEIYNFLRLPDRLAESKRTTNETDIFIKLNLDGSGKSSINTGLGFFDHMLELFSKHGMIDLDVQVKGDLQVDEHHTIEDTAIVLGDVLLKALGDKKGIERYGFLLPMDESFARVAVDFSGRSDLIWRTEFKREKIGEMPTEMFYHFFKSLSDSAKCNILIECEGSNEHHKIEAIFKALARAVKMAVKRDPGHQQLPSTKGIL